MINFKDIFNSWVKIFNPSEMELNRAKERFEVCLGCEFKKEVLEKKDWILYCGECGCVLRAKVYSSVINPCPKNKWEDVDKKYKSIPIMKNKESLL
jgi:hypothetical protein